MSETRQTSQKLVFNMLQSKVGGGIEKMFLDYTKILAYDFHVICLVPSAFIYTNQILALSTSKKNISIIPFNIKGHFDFFATIRLFVLIKKYQPDIILSHNGRTNSVVNIWRTICSSFLQEKVANVAISHGCFRRMKHFDAIFTVSNYLKVELEAKGFNQPIHWIPNFLATDTPPSTPTILASPLKEITFGTLSRIDVDKQVDMAVTAIAKLVRANPKVDISLKVAGDGNALPAVKEHTNACGMNSHVEFLGWIDSKKAFFERIDALLLPSLNESFGVVILEAAQHGVAVITSDTLGPSEIVKHNESGFIFDKNSAENLAAEMQKLIDEPALYTHIIEKAQKDLISKYSSESARKNLVMAIESTLADNCDK